MLIHLLFFLMIPLRVFFAADQPQFKGGEKNLRAFILNNMIYPEFSKQNCLQGTIQVKFKLNQQGRVFDSEVQTGYGIDLDREALRLVRLTSGRWIVPASHDTSSALILPVNFALKDYNCEKRSRDELNAALLAYRSREELNKAIYNFYEQRDRGQYNQEDEGRIISLKKQLGYDEKFTDRLLKQALRKMKQGDAESACDDLKTIHNLGSEKADKLIEQNCQ